MNNTYCRFSCMLCDKSSQEYLLSPEGKITDEIPFIPFEYFDETNGVMKTKYLCKVCDEMLRSCYTRYEK